jgi:hypothetical protein
MKHISPGIIVSEISSPSSSVDINSALVVSGTAHFLGDVIFDRPNFTSSWAINAISASFARTASFLATGTYHITASWALSSSQALTASYINPTFISASAAAAGFGSGGGGGVSPSLAIAYAIALG